MGTEIMKRNINIWMMLVAVVMLLSGCVSMETTRTSSNIAFKPLIGHDTRAVESVPFPQERSFKVWGVNQVTGETYIDGEMISYTSEGWLSKKLWPLEGMYFEACWPTDLAVEFSKSKGLVLEGFDCTDGDVDILFAKAYDDNEAGDVVTLSFDHILSRVEFRMMHSLSDGMEVRVKKIRMVGYAVVGDYGTRNAGEWIVGSPDHTYVVYDAGDTDGIMIPSGTAVYIGEELYVLPQPCWAALEVEYEVRHGSANWVPETAKIEALKTHWEPSKHYTYTVNLRMDKLIHTTGISSWENQ